MALFNFKRRSRKLRYFSANSSGWISDFSDKISGFIKSLKSLGLVKVLIYLAVILLLIVATLFAWYSKDLPNPYKFSSRTVSESTKILDRSGQLLYDVHGEKNRTLISFDQMPEYIKKATIAIEDKDFYHHSGFDVRGIIRALYNN